MAKNRNDIIRDIITALGGIPEGNTRNDLLQTWKDSLPAPLWTPAELTTALWLDASDATTISESGGYVSQWDDKSGNGNNAFQTLASSQPQTGVDTIGGLNALSFNLDLLLLDPLVDFSQYKSQELFAVTQANNDGRNKIFFSQFPGGFLHRYNATPMDIDFVALGGIGNVATPQNSLTNDLIYSAYANPSEIAVKISQAASYTTLSIPYPLANSSAQVGIGGRSDNQTLFNGKIGELVFVPSSLSVSDRYRMEGYLAWKWGLESLLHVGHPYKSQPPRI